MPTNASMIHQALAIGGVLTAVATSAAGQQQTEVVVTQGMVEIKDTEVRGRYDSLLAREADKSKKGGVTKHALADSLAALLGNILSLCIAADRGVSTKDLLARGGHGYLVHLAAWEGEAITKERWYVYDKGDGWASVRPTRLRLFGRREVTLLYLHTKAPRDPTYKLKITKKRQAPIQSLVDAADLALDVLEATKRGADTGLKCGGRQLSVAQPSDIAISVEVAPEAALKDAPAALQSVSKSEIDNEGLYWWDVSIGLPVTKVKELRYNSEDGVVRAEKIDRQNLLALVNVFPFKTDTKETRLQPPHLLAGIAITKKPLDRFFVGLGVGLNIAQVFVGYDFTKREVPDTLARGAAASSAELREDLRSFYKGVVVAGVNVPVREVLQAVRGE
ncbi:MAG: hypothetical protein H0T50_10735 [Gemmatimonadales bacterium]|nr:hypothetical protein [Gemmatimonadales bacterium]